MGGNNRVVIPKLTPKQVEQVDPALMKQVLDELDKNDAQLKQLQDLQVSLMLELAELKAGASNV